MSGAMMEPQRQYEPFRFIFEETGERLTTKELSVELEVQVLQSCISARRTARLTVE
jgi:hypothetical protein